MRGSILERAGADPAPRRTSTNCSTFLRRRAEAIIAVDHFAVVTLTDARLHAPCRD